MLKNKFQEASVGASAHQNNKRQYSIGEFSQISKLSIHTLRYYEKEKLLAPIRSENNRRCYSANDLAWLEFILRLKATGMPLKEIKLYADMRRQGQGTLAMRLAMLLEHQENLSKQIATLLEHKAKLQEKIKFYEEEIKKL